MKKALSILFSMSLTAILLSVFAAGIAYATFLENDFGTTAAKAAVYQAKWFEILLFVLSINLVGSLFKYKSFSKKKWSIILFHLAFVIIFLGAGITRYFGFEGSMHIREGYKANFITTYDNFVNYTVVTENESSVNSIKMIGKGQFGELPVFNVDQENIDLKIEATEYIKNAARMLQKSEKGSPIVKLVTADSSNQYQHAFLGEGETHTFGNVTYTFNNESTGATNAVNFLNNKDSLHAEFPLGVFVVDMKGQSHDSLAAGSIVPLVYGALYQIGRSSFIVQKFEAKGSVEVVSMEGHQGYYPIDAIKFVAESGNEVKEAYIFGGHNGEATTQRIQFGDIVTELSFGPKIIQLPFSLYLEDFIMERYSGSKSPSSYKSKIVLLDKENGLEEKHSIFMNNVLNHEGFRFFQSSFDSDEKGTVLSVNYDPIGTKVTYIGYFLMTIGMFLALFASKSRFRELLKRSSNKVVIIGLALLFTTGLAQAQSEETSVERIVPENKINPELAKEFGSTLVVDLLGRTKPINTLASELVRKITKKSEFEGYTPTEMFLGMTADPIAWHNAPIIKISHPKLKELLGTTESHVALNDLMKIKRMGGYVIKEQIDAAYDKKVNKRTKFDKEIIKVDERANICMMIFSGSMLTVFPNQNDTVGAWLTAMESKDQTTAKEFEFIGQLHSQFLESVRVGIKTNEWAQAHQWLTGIKDYQAKYGKNSSIDTKKINVEIFYNKISFFTAVGKYYLMFGMILLFALFVKVFNKNIKLKGLIVSLTGIIILLFALHTLFLGLRWYISGHAPWANGYETVVFIAWAAVLAGLLFSKRSAISLAVTAVLASILLLISTLSFMDPQITNLPPVLKSYWLVIHVAVITMSYGFFGLSALIGILNLIFVSLRNKKNYDRIQPQSLELGKITEMSVIIGLYLLTVGTFLGAVWANESWGRYWGWDPKETWALITVLVYTIVLHIRHIPGVKGVLPISIGSLFGLAAVLMTYFGVNYFLSGMHSYAGGDAFEIPAYVSWVVYALALLSITAIWRNAVFVDNETPSE